MEDAMSKTIEDLQAAFAGESQANRKYLAFAKKADTDGFPQVAKLFRAAAAADELIRQFGFRKAQADRGRQI
jgi:rubrerythrin